MTKRLDFNLDEGWSTLGLLLLLIIIAAVAIMQAELTAGTHVLPIVGILAIFSGLLLAKSRFSANTAHLFALVYGLFVVFYMVGTTLPNDMAWHTRIIDLVSRQTDWFQKAFSGGTSRDGLVFVLQTAVVFWLLGYTASWYTFRKPRVWRVILPTGLVLLSVVYYYYGPKPLLLYLAVYIVVSLVFVARTFLVSQEQIWRSASVRYERGIRTNFIRSGLLAALILLIVAYPLPKLAASTAVNEALSGTRGPWREFQETWTRLFSALRAYGTATSDPYQETMALGGPRSVGNDLVMDVYVPEPLPNLYWRAIAMDTYKDGGWSVSDGETTLHFPDDGMLQTPPLAGRETITQTVVNFLPNSSLLYGAPEVIGSTRQMFVDSTLDESGNELVTAVRSRFVLRQGDQYQVASSISNADIGSLRRAGTNYPQWVQDRYLQVPEEITPETISLAASLTADSDNVFDKATAVQNYLRENIVYNDQIDAPPPDVEPIHYTLFVSQEAYCTYYASAMAIMLRSQGIPARIVNGYVQGDYDEQTHSYRVRASNAHTWVEVYFPAYGWIQFEPTTSVPVLVRQESTEIAATDTAEEALAGGSGDLAPQLDDPTLGIERGGDVLGENAGVPLPEQAWWQRIPVWQVAGVILVLGIALVLIWVANEFNRRVESDVTRSYSRLESWAGWFGLHFRSTSTPYERADLMTAAVPEGKTSIRNLTQQFVLMQFSRTHGNGDEFDSLQEWRALRPLLLRKSIAYRLERWRRRKKRPFPPQKAPF
ncbi:MAG: transglutaminase domain-containing protein [Ardenticatenaceae bacterium]|nr:transglutaminase domain-containing protein [Ardenticatenaceae bacterium]